MAPPCSDAHDEVLVCGAQPHLSIEVTTLGRGARLCLEHPAAHLVRLAVGSKGLKQERQIRLASAGSLAGNVGPRCACKRAMFAHHLEPAGEDRRSWGAVFWRGCFEQPPNGVCSFQSWFSFLRVAGWVTALHVDRRCVPLEAAICPLMWVAVHRIQPMRLILCLSLASCIVAAGCSGPSERAIAADLYTRLQSGDCSAYVQLSEAAQKGLKYANTYLGLSLQTGHATKCLQPAPLALQAYNKVLKEVPEAAFNAALLELLAKRHQRAAELLELAAGKDKSGMPVAMVRLALLYESGAPDLLRNDSLAAQYFERASAAGDLYARFRFAQVLLAGKGRSADPPLAVELLESCALKGLPDAMLALHDLRKADPAAKEEAARWLGMYSVYRPAAAGRYNSFLATMTPREQKAVRDSVAKHNVSKQPEWKVPDYSSPVTP